MTRVGAFPRFVAAAVLLLYGGVFGAAGVLDAAAAAKANGQIAHVESDSGSKCAGHDEAACQLCQVRIATGCRASAAHGAITATHRTRPVAADRESLRAQVTQLALHSRAPPAA